MTEGQTAEQPQEQQTPEFSVPEAFAEKEWAKNIKSPDDLWSQFSNAQSLLGKRAVPTADASDEEWNNFYKQAGRPEKPEEYTFGDIEGLPEGVDLSPFKQKAASILHAAGLNQKQADKVWKQYIQEELQHVSSVKEQQAALDKEFDEITKKHFGEDASKVLNDSVSFANSIVPEDLRNVPAGLENNPQALAYIAALAKGAQAQINEVKKKYGAEDSITSGKPASGVDIMEVRTELARLRHSKEMTNFGSAEHKKTVARVAELEKIVIDYYDKK